MEEIVQLGAVDADLLGHHTQFLFLRLPNRLLRLRLLLLSHYLEIFKFTFKLITMKSKIPAAGRQDFARSVEFALAVCVAVQAENPTRPLAQSVHLLGECLRVVLEACALAA